MGEVARPSVMVKKKRNAEACVFIFGGCAPLLDLCQRSPVDEGTPQGGPLSPLLSNLVLDDLDKELTRRGLRFCRYADDCNIYVRSRRAGERVMVSVSRFLTNQLKLKVNEAKSAVARPEERKFLGFSVLQAHTERSSSWTDQSCG